MRFVLTFLVVLAAATSSLAAQVNPFKPSGRSVKSAVIAYTMSGSMSGTEELALDGDRMARRGATSMKMFGKTVTSETFVLTTPDSVYSVDLTKKTGFAMPNYGPPLADEYEHLSGKQKKQLQQNLELAAQTLGRAFGMGSIAQANQVVGQETVAGQACDVRKFGDWSVCALATDPSITLKTSGEVMCMEMNTVATSATINQGAPADKFAMPSGINWTPPDTSLSRDPKATAKEMLQMLSSEEFRDSLLAAQKDMKAAEDSAGVQQMTPEEREQSCAQLRAAFNVDLGAAFTHALGNVAKSAAKSAAENALKGAANSLRRRIRIP
jgi:hypothetical protein